MSGRAFLGLLVLSLPLIVSAPAMAAVDPNNPQWSSPETADAIGVVSNGVTGFARTGPSLAFVQNGTHLDFYDLVQPGFALVSQWALPDGNWRFQRPRMWLVNDIDESGDPEIVVESERENGTEPVGDVRILDLARGFTDPVAAWSDVDDTTSYHVVYVGPLQDPGFPSLGVLRTHHCSCGGVGQTLTQVLDYLLLPGAASVAAEASGPNSGFTLKGGRPNPFRSSTVFEYDLARSGDVEISIYDLSGREVRALPRHAEPAGRHEFRWNGTDGAGGALPPGLYFFALRVDGAARGRKAVLLP